MTHSFAHTEIQCVLDSRGKPPHADLSSESLDSGANGAICPSAPIPAYAAEAAQAVATSNSCECIESVLDSRIDLTC